MLPELAPSPDRFAELIALEPQVVKNLVPSNGDEQRAAFMAGDIHNPDHDYDRLQIDYDEAEQAIDEKGAALIHDPSRNPKFGRVYEQFVESYQHRSGLMKAAVAFKQAGSKAEADQAAETFMAHNRAEYGEPDETTYRSLLAEKVTAIAGKTLDGKAATIREELFGMVSVEPGEKIERFEPAEETVAWMHDVVMTLYGNFLRHVPDKATMTRDEIATSFNAILREEFGEAAEDWQAVAEKAGSVNVRATEKRIVIPENLKDQTTESVRGLVVHEIGDHGLRAIMGEQTDLQPLTKGLEGYFDAEEGLGVVMEQALKNRYAETGTLHYLTAGGAYFDGKDFRESYETRWRLEALMKIKDGQELTDEAIEKAQAAAYKGVMRIMRGTDALPLFKDLAYYNGAQSMWKHLESIRGDDTKFMFVLLGKADPSNIEHERIMYETRTA